MRAPIPLSQRRLDFVFIVFFVINILFITYQIDLAQLVIADPLHFTYPLWPPRPMVDAVHWWGRTFDPALMAREPWWRAAIWIDVLFYGPFYVFATYAFVKGRDWIRIPSLIWGASLLTNCIMILSEELYGVHATPRPGMVLVANFAWVAYPLLMVWRMAPSKHPFTVETRA